jgi:ATP-dependent DNA helicase RecG
VKKRVFISSVQKEFAAERRAVADYVRGDPLLSRFFAVFLFEDIPAADRRADEVYLSEVDRASLYVGLFGHDYGFEDAAGVSPTEREFDRATAGGKKRLIFVQGTDNDARHPKMRALIRKAGEQLIRRRFGGGGELTAALYASLV